MLYSRFSLVIYFIIAYICHFQSPNSSHPLPPWYPYICSLHLLTQTSDPGCLALQSWESSVPYKEICDTLSCLQSPTPAMPLWQLSRYPSQPLPRKSEPACSSSGLLEHLGLNSGHLPHCIMPSPLLKSFSDSQYLSTPGPKENISKCSLDEMNVWFPLIGILCFMYLEC